MYARQYNVILYKPPAPPMGIHSADCLTRSIMYERMQVQPADKLLRNREGLNIMDEIHEIRQKCGTMHDKVNTTQETLSTTEERLTAMQGTLGTMQEGLRTLREEFRRDQQLSAQRNATPTKYVSDFESLKSGGRTIAAKGSKGSYAWGTRWRTVEILLPMLRQS
jgi:hypothetical protein